MARTAHSPETEIEAARTLLGRAKTIQELRQAQSVLLPALTGATLETTAEILGLSRDRVVVLRREFRETGEATVGKRARGGRHHQLLTPEEEKAFLAPWIEPAAQGGVLIVPPIHAALEERVGHPVPKSTVYRLLARHGWRKVAPDTRHPKVDPEVQEAYKKTSRDPGPAGERL
jgi:transposase